MWGIGFLPVVKLWLQRHQTWNLIRRKLKVKIVGKTLIIWEFSEEDISRPLEGSLEEVQGGYKIYGVKIATLRPYLKIMIQGFLCQQVQQEETDEYDNGPKELRLTIKKITQK